MATVSFTMVKEWVSKNHLQPIKLKELEKLDVAVPTEDSKQNDGWSKRIVKPTTPLSAILTLQDDMYLAIPSTARYSQLRDETTDLQEKASLHLKGRGWPVRRTTEGIAGVGLEEEKHSTWTPLGWRALCALRECQVVLFDEVQKTVVFYPEDIRLWSSGRSTYIMDSTAHTILMPPLGYSLLKWIQMQEALGYVVTWPSVVGTMEEIKAAAVAIGVATVKITKDLLGAKVGQAQAIKHLKSW